MTTRKNGSGTLLYRQGYDLKNRLVEADADGDADTDLRLAYDHHEGRVARHTLDGTGAVTGSEHYLLDRMNPTGYEQVLEQAAGLDASPARSFVLGLSLVLQADGSTKRPFLFDGHGTGRALVDATGKIASGQVLAYDAFGVRTDAHSSVLTPIQYTGQWFDEVLGQGYHRHRYLTHASGRWSSFDAFEAEAEAPLGLHKYLYAGADAVNAWDPSGYVSFTELGFTVRDIAKRFGFQASRLNNVHRNAREMLRAINTAARWKDRIWDQINVIRDMFDIWEDFEELRDLMAGQLGTLAAMNES